MYVVVRGARMKLDDEVGEVNEYDVVRVPPGTWRGYEPGWTASEIPSSERPRSARIVVRTPGAPPTVGRLGPRPPALARGYHREQEQPPGG